MHVITKQSETSHGWNEVFGQQRAYLSITIDHPQLSPPAMDARLAVVIIGSPGVSCHAPGASVE
eukprot:scaffold38698_cov13-Prasinocladus_malaysianus.AAC.1